MKRISLRIPDGLYDKAKKIIDDEHYSSLSGVMRSAIRIGLKNMEGKK